VAAEVNEDPFELWSFFEPDDDIRLEQVYHPDMKLLCGRLNDPSR